MEIELGHLKHIIFSFLLSFTGITAFSQSSAMNDKYDLDERIPKPYFSISLLPLSVTSKASFKKSNLNYGIRSAPQLNFEASFNYHYQFERKFTLILGVSGGVVGHNFDYSIPADLFSPPLERDLFSNKAASREKELFYLKLPVSIEKKWNSRHYSYWNTAIGFSILFSPQKETSSDAIILLNNGTPYKYLSITQNNNNNGKLWVNYHFAGGYNWELSRKNTMRVNVNCNISLTDFATGKYTFDIPSQTPLQGAYHIYGSYVGISFSYLFTGVTKKKGF